MSNVQKSYHKLGKSDSKCLLLLNNCRTHPHETKLASSCKNVSCVLFTTERDIFHTAYEQSDYLELKMFLQKGFHDGYDK